MSCHCVCTSVYPHRSHTCMWVCQWVCVGVTEWVSEWVGEWVCEWEHTVNTHSQLMWVSVCEWWVEVSVSCNLIPNHKYFLTRVITGLHLSRSSWVKKRESGRDNVRVWQWAGLAHRSDGDLLWGRVVRQYSGSLGGPWFKGDVSHLLGGLECSQYWQSQLNVLIHNYHKHWNTLLNMSWWALKYNNYISVETLCTKY